MTLVLANMPTKFEKALATLPFERFGTVAPASSEHLREMERELDLALTPELRGLFEHVGPAYLGRVLLYERNLLCDRVEIYRQPEYARSGLRDRGFVFFGNNGGSVDYFVDVRGALGQGDGAVFAVDAAAAEEGRFELLAPDLLTFLERAADGKEPRGRSLGQLRRE
jgi:hypothetical protein